MPDPRIKTSKFLSYVLRHKPESIGLTLDSGGWAETQVLIDLANTAGKQLTLEQVQDVVAWNAKQRFSFSPDGRRIRAVQGHSIAVDLKLEPVQPPESLFHGTAKHSLDSILDKGLLKMRRQHVHLSLDVDTASAVGRRHGELVVLTVAAGAMCRDGHEFFRSENGVWLVDHVPPMYLSLTGDG
ncbi:MAG: RNA 2'-phosphotransferase [Acidobacteriota bacterium]